MTAMLNGESAPAPGSWPRAMRSLKLTPHSSAKVLKYRSIISRGNRSIPAGTGVWVVKTVPARTASTASGNRRPSSVTSWRIRSRPRKPAWPSLVWKIWVSSPAARSARTPPMPSRISWRIRCSASPA